MPTLAEDRDAIRDLLARYCHYVDTGAVDEWVATFTEDAEFVAGADSLVGHSALRTFATGITPGTVHHMLVNEAIDIDGDTASCRSSVFMTANGSCVGIGRADDELRRVDGSWRIARRAVTFDAP